MSERVELLEGSTPFGVICGRAANRDCEAALGLSEPQRFADWNNGQPETELNRQATNMIPDIPNEVTEFLSEFC